MVILGLPLNSVHLIDEVIYVVHTETCKGDDLLPLPICTYSQSRQTIHIHQHAYQALAQTEESLFIIYIDVLLLL